MTGMTDSCDPSTPEAEAGESPQVQGPLGLPCKLQVSQGHSKILSHRKGAREMAR